MGAELAPGNPAMGAELAPEVSLSFILSHVT